MLNPSQRSNICDAYADLLKQLKDFTPSTRSESRHTWKKTLDNCLSTRDFKRSFASCYPDFKGYDQHDSHEFFTALLDSMSKELNRVKVKPKYKEIKISSKEAIEKQARKWYQHYKEIEDSHITDYFQGQTVTEIKCTR